MNILYIRNHLIYVAMLLSTPLAQAATPAPPGVRVYALTYMSLDENSANPGYSQVSVTSSDSAETRIAIPSVGVSEYSLLRSNNDYTTQFLTNTNNLHNNVSEGNSDRAVIVVTRNTSDVFGSRFMAASGDAFHALPLTVNSRTFFIPSFKSMATGNSFYGIAAASTACLQVYYFTDTGGFQLQESVSLTYGEVFQRYAPGGDVDFTGLYVSSSAPVSVFSGHVCAQMPAGTSYCDHLVDQIPSNRFWGTTTLVPPVTGRNADSGYTARVLVQTDTTITFPHNPDQVTYQSGCDSLCTAGSSVQDCSSPCEVRIGRYMQVRINDAEEPVTVVCSLPCLVVQYGHSLEASASPETHDPDPFMAVITPVDHYVNSVSYVTPRYYDGTDGAVKHYVNFLTMVVLTSDLAGLRLDGEDPTTGDIVATKTQGAYTVLSRSVTDGTHFVSHTDPSKTVMAFPLGHAPLSGSRTSTSYRFSAAYEIDDLTIAGEWADLIDIPSGVYDPDVTTAEPRTCVRTGGSSSLTASFVMRGVDTAAEVLSCDALMTPVLAALTTQINDAICQRTICPNAPDDVYVKNMYTETVNGTLQLSVDLANSLDATAMSMVECRVHIGDYLRRVDYWGEAGLTSDSQMTCFEVIVTLEKIYSSWECPITTLG